MLRCVLPLALLCASLPAAAQLQRSFPANALRGEILVQQPPDVLLNGRAARLAPGARVHGPDNLTVVSGALAHHRWVVNYTLDGQGALLDVWVLTPAELAKRPWPTTPEQATQWHFDPLAQTWARP